MEYKTLSMEPPQGSLKLSPNIKSPAPKHCHRNSSPNIKPGGNSSEKFDEIIVQRKISVQIFDNQHNFIGNQAYDFMDFRAFLWHGAPEEFLYHFYSTENIMIFLRPQNKVGGFVLFGWFIIQCSLWVAREWAYIDPEGRRDGEEQGNGSFAYHKPYKFHRTKGTAGIPASRPPRGGAANSRVQTNRGGGGGERDGAWRVYSPPKKNTHPQNNTALRNNKRPFGDPNVDTE